MSRVENKETFIKAAAEFLGGANQARMSIGLEMGGELGEVAKLWSKMRNAVPGLHGYPSTEDTAEILRELL